ncbi:MAG: hypothetical protein MZV65_35900 [Chromatiales bacterium]|nr:hypothetical protein [Chromatiales bacterium]
MPTKKAWWWWIMTVALAAATVLNACPYSARTTDFGYTYVDKNLPMADGLILGRDDADDYERAANYEYGREWERSGGLQSPVGNARKCHFCLHRVHEGELPACTTTCIGRATLLWRRQ